MHILPWGGMAVKQHKRYGLLLFLLGGTAYILLELCWRRRTHPSMFVVGGVCFRLIGKVYTVFSAKALWLRCVISALAVTAVEFISGCFLNLYLKCNVWDYTHKRCNLLGQVCLLYSVLWGLLSIPAAALHSRCLRFVGRRTKRCQRTRITAR